MRAHDLRLLTAAALAWAGVALTLALGGRGPAFLVLAGVAGVVTAGCLMRRGGAAALVALAAAVTTLLAVTSATHEFRDDAGPMASWAEQGAVVTADVVVEKEPVRIATTRPQADPSYAVPARVRVITGRGRRWDINTPVLVIGAGPWKDVHWQDHVSMRARVRPATRFGPARAVLLAAGKAQVSDDKNAVLAGADWMRANLRTSLARIPPDPRGLSAALVDGDVSQLPDDLKDVMNEVGMSHLNAVSGSNVTIVLVASLWLCGWCGIGRRGRFVVGSGVVVGYVLLCHPDPSVIRAAAMGVVGAVGTTMGRPRAAAPALGAAIVVLLAWDPWLAVNAGFALSSLATLGLVLLARSWTHGVAARLPSWCAKPCELVMIPVAAQALCLPVLIALNPSVNLMAIPANVMAEPFVAPATLGGMGLLLISPIPDALRQFLAWPVALPSCAIATVARGTAAVPHTTLPWPEPPWGPVLAVGLLAAVVGLWCLSAPHRRRAVCALAGVFVLAVAALVPLPGAGRVPSGWRYAMCDVGQGDASLISTGQPGHAIAVDVGPSGTDQIVKCLHRHSVTALDAIVLTHFHADHVGALPLVLRHVTVGRIFVTPVRIGADEGGGGEQGAAPVVDAAVRAASLPTEALPGGAHLEIGDLRIDVLWPRRVIHEGSVQNNASIVLDVSARDSHLLLLGDAEKETDSAVRGDVAERAANHPYDVVKVGHHGSGNQSPQLYTAARARYGAIGVGLDNDYGHPARKLLGMLDQAGTRPCRTDEVGDISFAPSPAGLIPAAAKGSC